MVSLIIAAILLVLAALILLIERTFNAIPLIELQRRARSGDSFASHIYPVAAYDRSLRVMLWFLAALFSAIALALLARMAPVIFGAVAVVIWVIVAYYWLPSRNPPSWALKLTILLTAPIERLVSFSYPLLKKTEGLARRPAHSGLFDTEDLLLLLEQQATQPDSRIPISILARIGNIIAFEQAVVSKHMKPWTSVVSLSEKDIVGPKLLDELHKAKQLAFPVEDSKGALIGLLNKGELTLTSSGRVGDFCRPIHTIPDSAPLEQALALFASTGAPMLVCVDIDQEPSGIISLKAILSYLLTVGENSVKIDTKKLDEAATTGRNNHHEQSTNSPTEQTD